jgi:glyoxylase-like metal-dependent hydrolase (beta-lactamase superfamily II)
MRNSLAKVKILLPGYFKWIGSNKCQASCTVTLIQDDKKNIIVDTGTRSNQEKLIKALAKEKLKPVDIDYVIITHAHTDHVENLGLFSLAQSLNVFESKKGDVFQISEDILTKGEKQLTTNVHLIFTPGHTAECLTVMAKSEQGMIAVAGDLFVKKQTEKGIFIEDEKSWQKSRKKILKLAEYIIPGHGPIFKVKK